MTRSVWKGPFSVIRLKRRKVSSRRSMVLPKHLGRVYKVYNGKTHIFLKISKEMIGHKFGEFSMTRRRGRHKRKG